MLQSQIIINPSVPAMVSRTVLNALKDTINWKILPFVKQK